MKMKDLFKGINVPGTIIISILGTIIMSFIIQPSIDVARDFSGNIFTFFIALFFRCAATVFSSGFSEIFAIFAIVIFTMYAIMDIRNKIEDSCNFCKEKLDEINELKKIRQKIPQKYKWNS